MKAHIVQSSKFVCLCWKGWAWSVSCKHRCACYSLSTRYASHFWTPPMEMYPKFSSLRHKGWTWTVEKIWWWNDQNDGIILSKIYLRVCVCVLNYGVYLHLSICSTSEKNQTWCFDLDFGNFYADTASNSPIWDSLGHGTFLCFSLDSLKYIEKSPIIWLWINLNHKTNGKLTLWQEWIFWSQSFHQAIFYRVENILIVEPASVNRVIGDPCLCKFLQHISRVNSFSLVWDLFEIIDYFERQFLRSPEWDIWFDVVNVVMRTVFANIILYELVDFVSLKRPNLHEIWQFKHNWKTCLPPVFVKLLLGWLQYSFPRNWNAGTLKLVVQK